MALHEDTRLGDQDTLPGMEDLAAMVVADDPEQAVGAHQMRVRKRSGQLVAVDLGKIVRRIEMAAKDARRISIGG